MNNVSAFKITAQTFKVVWRNMPVFLLVVVPPMAFLYAYKRFLHEPLVLNYLAGVPSSHSAAAISLLVTVCLAVFIHRKVQKSPPVNAMAYVAILAVYLLILAPFAFLGVLNGWLTDTDNPHSLTRLFADIFGDGSLTSLAYAKIATGWLLSVPIFFIDLLFLLVFPLVAANRSRDFATGSKWSFRYYLKNFIGFLLIQIFLTLFAIAFSAAAYHVVFAVAENLSQSDDELFHSNFKAMWIAHTAIIGSVYLIFNVTYASVAYLNIAAQEEEFGTGDSRQRI